MSRVIFMCGPTGAGKSTRAKALERAGMVRLSFDVEAWRRGITTMPLSKDVRDDIERNLRSQLLALVAAGVDVVLDFSFWSREMRDDYRRLLERIGVIAETMYLATERATILERVAARRTSHADDYELDEFIAGSYFDRFEPPTPAEGPLTVIK